MEFSRSDAIWFLVTSISLITGLFTIFKWDLSNTDPSSHIKAIYSILLIVAFVFAWYVILTKTNSSKKNGKK